MVKKKIISSLTVAGIIGISATGVVNAATTNDTTKTDALGVYSNIVEGKKVVPFILQSEDDRVTIADLKAKYPSAVIEGTDNTVLKTGDTFTLNGVEHSVLVYGDVYADGEVDIFDTMEIIKGIKGQGTLSDLQKAAANVNRSDDTIDIFDVMNVNSVLKGAVNYENLTTAPTGADEEKQEEDKKPDDTTATGKLESKEIKVNTTKSTATDKYADITLEFTANSEGYDYIIHNDTDNETIRWTKVQDNENKVTLTTTDALTEKNANGKLITYSITVLDENAKQVAKDTFEFRADSVSNAVALSFTDSKYKEISATNVNDLSLKVEVAEDMDYDTTVEVKLVNYKKNAIGTYQKDTKGNYINEREAVGTAKLTKGQKVVTVNNFKGVSDLEDDTLGVIITVKDQFGNISEVNDLYPDNIAGGLYTSASVATGKFTVINKNAQEFKATYVQASRTGTENASVTMILNQKLAVTNNEDIKVYYVVAKASENGTPTKAQIEDGKVYEQTVTGSTNGTDRIQISSLEIKNGVSSDEYVVYLIAERANGSQTDIASAKITSVGAKQLSRVDNIQATSGFGNYRWTDSENEKENPNDVDGYNVIVYAEHKTNAADVKAIATKKTTTKSVDVSSEIKEFASKKENNGIYTKYHIGVVAVAKNGLRDSEIKEDTSSVVLTQLDKPIVTGGTNKIYADEEKNYDLMLAFSPNSANTEKDTSLYQVSIYKVDKDGNRAKDATKSVNVATTATKDDVDLTSLLFKGQDKGKYAVTVKALAFEGEKFTDSEESDDVPVYYVGAPTSLEVKATDDKTLKVSVTEIPEIYSSDKTANVTYNAFYREKTKSNSNTWTNAGAMTNRNGTTVSIDITTGISADTEYEAYVVAYYNAYEISRTETKASTTANKPLDLSAGYTKVVYDNKTIGLNEITNNGDTLYVGVPDNTTSPATLALRKVTADNGVDNYKEILDIVKAMSKGDKIESNNKGENIKVTKNVTGGSFGNTLQNAELVVNADSIALSADKVKKVTVNSTNTTTTKDIDKVYLGNVGVGDEGIDLTTATNLDEIEIKTGTKVMLPVSTSKFVKINGVYVNAKAGNNNNVSIEVSATGANELTIKGTDSDIVIASEVDANKTIKFTDSQTGTVSVISAKSDKTITLDGAINVVNIGYDYTQGAVASFNYASGNIKPASKGIVDVTNVGYSALNLVDVGAKVSITKVNKEISLNTKVYTFKPTGTMTVEKVKINDVDKLQVSGAGTVEFASTGVVDENTIKEVKTDESIISSPKTLAGTPNTTITTVSSTVKYRVTDGKAYISLEGNGKATLEENNAQ